MSENWYKDYSSIELHSEEALGTNNSLGKMLSFIGTNKLVVDFGCASGYFAQLLTTKGCIVTGIEINPEAAKLAEQYCQQVIVADLDFVSLQEILPNQHFDVAIFGDVLEHLRNPWQVLKEAKTILNPDGYVVASIPNIAHGSIRLALLQGKFEYSELGILDNTHLRFFTRKTVNDLFNKSGYLIELTDRTTLPIFTDNSLVPEVNQHEFNLETIQKLEADKDAQTLQFIIKAVPSSIEKKYAILHEQHCKLLEREQELLSEVQSSEVKLEQSQSQLQNRLAELELFQTEVKQIQADLEQSQSQLQNKQTELELSQSELQQSQEQLQQSQLELEQIKTQLNQSRSEFQQSQALIAAIQTSTFWQLRRVWFKFRSAIGIKDEAKPLLAFPERRRNQIEKLKWTWKQQGTKGTVSFLQKYIRNKIKQRTSYQEWIEENRLHKLDIIKAKREIEKFAFKPKFSVIVPVYNVEQKWLEKAIESVRNQIYPYWELCIADDASPKPHIRSVLTKYSKLDSRIKVAFREQNANISAASNSALELATGEYIALLDHDDELAVDALFENAKLINLHPDADFIYSDEDKIDTSGNRLDPFFKPDWSPEYFHSCMYTCHLGIYRSSLIREIGGFRSEYDGSQDYDLVLRVIEKTQNIYHIPKILYHWRIIPASVTSGEEAKPWAYIAARKALEAMLERSQYSGTVEETTRSGFWRVRRDIVGEPLISIVIPSGGTVKDTPKGSLCLLENCINSIQNLSSYRKFEIVVVDGYDIPQSTLDRIANDNVELVRCREPFNFSMRINMGAAKAKGQFVLLLNDDTEVITPDWLESMLEFAQQKEIGAVGAKLFYPDGKIQHAGVMVLDGNPGHAFHGMEGDHPGYFCSNIVNRNYICVTAACLMMRKEVFEELGGLDESFPLNYNDVDLCLKAHQAGYRNVVTPYVQLTHYESASRAEGLRPGEWEQLNDRWNSYLESLNGDPFYNCNLSCKNANFELL